MSGLVAVLDRLVNDAAFRDAMRADPGAALRGYPLSDEDRAALSSPGPHWIELAARALRQTDIPRGPSWDPAERSVTEGEPAGEPEGEPAPEASTELMPDARVLLRLVPAQLPSGDPGWAVSLFPDEPATREALADDLAVAVRASVTSGSLDAHADVLQPTIDDAEPADPFGPRWGHRTGPAVWGAAARVRAAPREERLEALAAYLEVVSGRAAPPEESEPPPAPPPRAEGPADITVVGLGITGVEHVTREAEAAIRRANEVLYLAARPGILAFLKARCRRVTPLFGAYYVSWSARMATYDGITAAVLDAAMERGPVVMAVQGHPTVFSYVPLMLRDAVEPLGLSVHIQPGVSSEDCAMAALGIDPGDHGIQAYEATDLLLRRRPLRPDVATLIWQVGSLETRLHTGRPSRPERLTRFVAWLQRWFPADHPVVAVHVPTLPGLPTQLEMRPLEELADMAHLLHAAVSLYLPPVGRRAIADPVLARLVDDPAHLARITRAAPDVTDL